MESSGMIMMVVNLLLLDFPIAIVYRERKYAERNPELATDSQPKKKQGTLRNV
jgi:hypothetical protein